MPANPVNPVLAELSRLKDGWCGEASRAPTHKALHAAAVIMREIPRVAPTENGGLELEWNREGVSFILTINPDGSQEEEDY